MTETNALFRAHMLLLRWGEERLAREAEEAKKATEEAAEGEHVPTLPKSQKID